jgi:hypothetical protein
LYVGSEPSALSLQLGRIVVRKTWSNFIKEIVGSLGSKDFLTDEEAATIEYIPGVERLKAR